MVISLEGKGITMFYTKYLLSPLAVFTLVAGLFAGLAAPVFAGSGAITQADLDQAPECGPFPSQGESYLCKCPSGFAPRSLWGSGPYTGDSDVCTAALQSGVITKDGGPVLLKAAPGQDSYAGSTQNGVTSFDWGGYGRSFQPVPLPKVDTSAIATCTTLPAGVDSYTCACGKTAKPRGSVWGSSPYTADSNICAAAIHSGILDKNGGTVTVLRVQGLDSYAGSESFGVRSSDWKGFDSSFVFDWNR